MKIPHFTFKVHCLLLLLLLCLKRTHFSKSSISRFTPFALQERKINFFIPKRDRKYSHTKFYDFAITLAF